MLITSPSGDVSVFLNNLKRNKTLEDIERNLIIAIAFKFLIYLFSPIIIVNQSIGLREKKDDTM